jgi:hypothetical protein
MKLNPVLIVIGIIFGIIIISLIQEKKACPEASIKRIFRDEVDKYPDINPKYNIKLSDLQNAGCMKSYERKKSCDSLSPCITFIPYFCSESGRIDYANDQCMNEATQEAKNKCISNILGQIYVYKTINCNDVNKKTIFPMSMKS